MQSRALFFVRRNPKKMPLRKEEEYALKKYALRLDNFCLLTAFQLHLVKAQLVASRSIFDSRSVKSLRKVWPGGFIVYMRKKICTVFRYRNLGMEG